MRCLLLLLFGQMDRNTEGLLAEAEQGKAAMGTNAMGRVTAAATIENMKDLWEVECGMRPADQARKIALQDALVDTGATVLSLPTASIRQLGLRKLASKRVTSSQGGVTEADLYEAVRLTIQGRTCTIDVLEVADNVPTLIGQVPLELLDFVVDLRGGKLVGNPAHGGEHVFEMY
jgi:predicted aspartyl protease